MPTELFESGRVNLRATFMPVRVHALVIVLTNRYGCCCLGEENNLIVVFVGECLSLAAIVYAIRDPVSVRVIAWIICRVACIACVHRESSVAIAALAQDLLKPSTHSAHVYHLCMVAEP